MSSWRFLVSACARDGLCSAISLMFFKIKMNGPLWWTPFLLYRSYGLLFLVFFGFFHHGHIKFMDQLSFWDQKDTLMSSIEELAQDVCMDRVKWKWKGTEILRECYIIQLSHKYIWTHIRHKIYLQSVSVCSLKKTQFLCSLESNKNRWQLKWSMYAVR